MMRSFFTNILLWPSRWAGPPRVSPLGLCVISSCAATPVLGWMQTHHYFAPDVYGDNFLVMGFMFAAVPFGVVVQREGILIAVGYLCALAMIGAGVQVILVTLFPWWPEPGLALTAGLCGAAAFFVLLFSWKTIAVGMLCETTGYLLVVLIAWIANQLWPMRFVYLSAGGFAWLVSFGPVMGLSVGIPARIILKKKLRREQQQRQICISCGYDLRGSQEAAACPECGAPIAQHTSASPKGDG